MTVSYLRTLSMVKFGAAAALLACLQAASVPSAQAETPSSATSDVAAAPSAVRQSINAMLETLEKKMPSKDVDAILDEAEAAYKAAEADDVAARLDFAAAMWLEGRQIGKMSGFMRGLPQRSRDLLNEIVAAEPDNAQALGQLGVWHMDVYRRGGESGAKRLGADFETGLEFWRRAQTLDPDDAVMSLHGGVLLLAVDPDAHGEEARAALTRLANAEGDTSLEAALSSRAQSVLALLDDDDDKPLDEALESWLGRQ